MERIFAREAIVDAVRFWERARVPFNVILLAYGLFHFSTAFAVLPASLWAEAVAVMLFANLLYSVVYVPDLILLATDYRHLWRVAGRPFAWLAITVAGTTLVRITLLFMLHGA